MTDKELLELAAKAAGIDGWVSSESKGVWDEEVTIPAIFYYRDGRRDTQDKAWWSPLQDDGDALRLAVKLQIDIDFEFTISTVRCLYPNEPFDAPDNVEKLCTDPYAATRRAIVRAAAEIGKTL